MRLYVATMDAVVTDVAPDGRVELLQEGWIVPTLQERRAILHAAHLEIGALEELIAALDRGGSPDRETEESPR